MMTAGMLLAVTAILTSPVDQSPADLARSIMTAAEANRDLITRGHATLTYSIGTAENLEAALAGRWADRTVANGQFAIDLPSARYDQLFDMKEMNAQRSFKGGGYSTRLISGRVVTDGRVTLSDGIKAGTDPDGGDAVRRPTIEAGTDPFLRLAHLPLFLGVPSPDGTLGPVIRDAVEGRGGWSVESVKMDSSLDGVEVAEVVIRTGATGRCRFWVDLKRGAVAIQVRNESADGKEFMVERYDDLRQVAGTAWLPFRKTEFVSAGLVNEIQILKAQFDQPPDKSLFRLDFPKPLAVSNMAAKTRYAEQTSWDLAKLPTGKASGSQPIVERTEQMEVMPGERQAAPVGAVVALVAGIALVLVAVVQYRRRAHA